MQKPTVVKSQHIHTGRVITLSTETLHYANGRDYDIDFIRHPGAAAVVPVDAAGRVCMVRQYRHGIEDFLWEIPAGKLDAGEDPKVCAVRELQEETGIIARRWDSLGLYVPAPGLFTEVIHLFMARDLTKGEANPDADEELELQWLPLHEALKKVTSGEWNDGKSALALMRTQCELRL